MPLNTTKILEIMRDAIMQYEIDCKHKLAGLEGEKRKLNFEQLLQYHQDSSAESLLVKIYDFYIDDSAFNSRLIRYIEDGLIRLICNQSRNEFTTYRACGYLKELEQLAAKIEELRVKLTQPLELKCIC